MPVVKVRPKGQITIPIDILNNWNLHSEEKVNITLINGIVILTPLNRLEKKKSIMSYAGIASGIWGADANEIDNFIRDERDSWEK